MGVKPQKQKAVRSCGDFTVNDGATPVLATNCFWTLMTDPSKLVTQKEQVWLSKTMFCCLC